MTLTNQEVADHMHDHYRELARLEYDLATVSIEASRALKRYTAIIAECINLMGSGQWYPWEEDRHLRMVWAVMKQTLYNTDHYIHHLHNDLSDMLTGWHDTSTTNLEARQALLNETERYMGGRFVKDVRHTVQRWRTAAPTIDKILAQERVQPANYPEGINCPEYTEILKCYAEAMSVATDSMWEAMRIVRRGKVMFDLWDAETINKNTEEPYRNRQYIHDFLKLFNHATNNAYHHYLCAHRELTFCSETYSRSSSWADSPQSLTHRLERIAQRQTADPAITIEDATTTLTRYTTRYTELLQLITETAEANGF